MKKEAAYWKMKLSPEVVFCEGRNVKGFDRKRIAAVGLGNHMLPNCQQGWFLGNNVFPITGQAAVCGGGSWLKLLAHH